MSQHTPGPWYSEIETHQAPLLDRYAAAVHVGSPWDGTLRTLARIPEGDPPYDDEAQARAEADAHLIAAAPEMLAVLESIYVDLVDYSKRLSGAYSTGAIALSSCADQVSAVIRKAKGGAS